MDFFSLISENRTLVLALAVPSLTLILAFGLDRWHGWHARRRRKTYDEYLDRLRNDGA